MNLSLKNDKAYILFDLKDQVGDAHGGVFVCFKRDLICTEVPELETDCELVLVKLQIVDCKTLYLGSVYPPPDITDPEYLDQLNSSLKRNMAYKNSHVLIGGGFNCWDIDWKKLYAPLGMPRRQVQSHLVALPLSGYRYSHTTRKDP